MGRIDAGQLLLGTLLVSGLGAGDAMAQAPTTVAAADYERAAKMLGDRTAPLVDGGVRGVAWLDDGSVVYGAPTAATCGPRPLTRPTARWW